MMACCGKGREQLRMISQDASPARPETTAPAGRPMRSFQTTLFFEYAGNTGLTVVGARSGRRYRFDRPGARLEIDLRDRPQLSAIPKLRQCPH